MEKRTFLILSALVVLLAFVVREWFVLTMVVPEPNQGDVGAYLRYALHLVWDGTFSMNNWAAIPDAFRSPGYPMVLAALFPSDGSAPVWFARVYQAQVLLGTATVAMTIALARRFMPFGFALMAGLWMAVQPHHVASTGTLLTECLFGALLLGGLLAASYERGWLAGLGFGLSYLTNPVGAVVPLVSAVSLQRKQAVAMLLVVGVAIGGWAVRNAVVDAHGGRAMINFVQGSWPEYHDTAKWPWRWPAKYEAINREVAAGEVAPVVHRLAEDPARYAGWYASKPWLLFDWEVRIGHGMAYVVTMRDTPLDKPPLLMTTTLQWVLNPLLFCLAFCGIVLGLVRGGTEQMVALSVIALTAVHVLFQAEPRYSIPYRSLEVVLAFGALAYLDALRRTLTAPAYVNGEEGGVKLPV